VAAGEIRAGKAFVEIFLKGNLKSELDKLSKQLKQFGESITSIGKKMAGLGAAITAPLALAAVHFANVGSAINDAAARTGLGTDAIQEFAYAAAQTGASMEDVEAGVRKMSKAIFEAETGSKQAKESLASIGLTVADLKGLKPEEQFRLIAQHLNGVEDAGAKSAISMELLGKGGTALIPMMSELAEQTKRFRSLGILIPAADIEAADKFGDTLDDLKKQVDRVITSVGAAVAQALQPFADGAKKILKTIIEWTNAHRPLVIGVLAAGAALVAAGTAVIGLGLSFKIAGAAISGITSAFGLVTGAIGLLLNPITLVAVAIVGLAAYFAYTTGFADQAFTFLAAKFNQLKDTAVTAFGGIADALSAGDIQLAGQILWTGLQLLWTQGTQELQTKWLAFKAAMVDVAVDAFYGVMNVWAEVSAGLQSAFAKTSAFFTNIWHDAVNTVSGWFEDLAVAYMKIGKSDDEKAFIDQQAARQRQIRDQEQQDAAGAREAELQKELAAIEKTKQAKLDANADSADAISQAAGKNAADDAAALDKRKKELEEQLKALRTKAGDEKKQSDANKPKSLTKPGIDLNDLVSQRNAAATKAVGTFNAAGLQGLQGGAINFQERTAKATEETAKMLWRIAKEGTVWN
jgi:hypothetical protein